jgi:hypothetical protein
MATGSGWIKVGERLINLALVQEIDLEDQECDYESWVADKDDSVPPSQRCVTLTFGFGDETHNDAANFFGGEAEALRAWLSDGHSADGSGPDSRGPLGAIDVLAWYAAEVKAEPPAFQIGG